MSIIKLHHEDAVRVRACLMTTHPARGELSYVLAVLDKAMGGTPKPLEVTGFERSHTAEAPPAKAPTPIEAETSSADDPFGLNAGTEVEGLL